jgi:transketolase
MTLKTLGDLGFGDNQSRNIYFGVCEHAMAAMVCGMALHGDLICFGATFFNFSDCTRTSLRVAALMGVHSTFVFIHDIMGLGQDGQPQQLREHLTSSRAMPELTGFRVADAKDTSAAATPLINFELLGVYRPNPVNPDAM